MIEPRALRESDGVKVADVARDVVTAIAPQEMDLLVDVTVAWQSGDFSVGGGAPAAWRGGAIGSGLDPLLVSLIIYPMLTGAIGQVIGAAADRGARRLWRRGKRRPDPVISVAVFERVEAVRVACVTQAMAAGVPRPRAELIADAIYGALLRAEREGNK